MIPACDTRSDGRTYGQTESNIANTEAIWQYKLSHSAPPLPMFPLEFRAEVNHEETRVMGLSSSEDPLIVARVILTQCQRVTDRQTDRRTDGLTIASTALCIASYVDAL